MCLQKVLLAPTGEPLTKYASHLLQLGTILQPIMDTCEHVPDGFEIRVRADEAPRGRRVSAVAHRTAVACQEMTRASVAVYLPRLRATGNECIVLQDAQAVPGPSQTTVMQPVSAQSARSVVVGVTPAPSSPH